MMAAICSGLTMSFCCKDGCGAQASSTVWTEALPMSSRARICTSTVPKSQAISSL